MTPHLRKDQEGPPIDRFGPRFGEEFSALGHYFIAITAGMALVGELVVTRPSWMFGGVWVTHEHADQSLRIATLHDEGSMWEGWIARGVGMVADEASRSRHWLLALRF